ncbi:SRA stem-loop-interacting RNA-binding protein, mitochondrial-like [Leptinotarsa decemlineata]|uniref:SRA stem-loop-interacting RNA-binding protein, mitochondrial-like n=1 Tax=Leptinotarsa decemlineata TaxID=7539 RepID=UPI000C255906|nr:SRA stem-loop-interacting RNA-binding protein, mitochondrial-like [Leptinotarsa decemlineata]
MDPRRKLLAAIGKCQFDSDPDANKLFVTHIQGIAKRAYIRQHFNQYGRVRRVQLGFDRSTGNFKGYAFVQFELAEDLDNALAAEEHIIQGHKVIVAKVVPRPPEDVDVTSLCDQFEEKL